MLYNLFLTAIRNLVKNRAYSLINIFGLAIGISCSILILLWVQDERSYDAFHPKADRLYQLWVNSAFDGKINSWNSVPLPTYEALKSADTRIVSTAVTDWSADHLLTVGEKAIIKNGYYVSEEFLEMFAFPLQSGDASTVLDEPASIVLTASTARALFGEQDPLGKMVKLDDAHMLQVSGILEDLPENSSFEFDYLLTWKFRAQTTEWVVENQDNWGNYSFQVLVELANPGQEKRVEEGIRHLLQEHGETDLKPELFLHPLLRWHLHSNFEDGVEKGGQGDYVQLFTIIAVFILLIACINFMNLATARSEKRAREVGIRKSLGSGKVELVLQFLGESMLITLSAFVVALLLCLLLMPLYNQLVEKNLSLDLTRPEFWGYALLIVLVVGVVAGSYPAFYLSSFQPARVLKGKLQTGKKVSTPRKILVMLQFGFSILLIIGTLVITEQIKLVTQRKLGYQQERLITTDYNDGLRHNYQAIKNTLLQRGLIEGMTVSNSSITNINSNNFLNWPGKPEEERVIFTTIAGSYDYAQTMGIDILIGRDFSESNPADSSAILVNQAALDIMNLEDPIGTQLELWGEERTLIGVLDNVLMGSPYEPVKPMFVILATWGDATATLRLADTPDLQGTLAQVQGVFTELNPAYPFAYEFVDESFQKKFSTIRLTSRLAKFFALLVLVITGLGLLGLASFMAEQRTQEIGIRKVLGASVASILSLMSQEYSRLLGWAFLVFAPLAWWLLKSYLARYPIRTEIYWWIFPLTAVLALAFTLLVVSMQTWKAAQTNPAQSLRKE